MQTTKRLLGASRLPLTTKRGNKDYYKGLSPLSLAEPSIPFLEVSFPNHTRNPVPYPLSRELNRSLGTRQAFVPGESRRTGPPGKHVLRGQAKYRILDEQVRYFVSPGPETLRNTEVCPLQSLNSPIPSPFLPPSSSLSSLPYPLSSTSPR